MYFSEPEWRTTMFKFIEGLPHDVLAVTAIGSLLS
jgi:hypothetical protein